MSIQENQDVILKYITQSGNPEVSISMDDFPKLGLEKSDWNYTLKHFKGIGFITLITTKMAFIITVLPAAYEAASKLVESLPTDPPKASRKELLNTIYLISGIVLAIATVLGLLIGIFSDKP